MLSEDKEQEMLSAAVCREVEGQIAQGLIEGTSSDLNHPHWYLSTFVPKT